MRGCTMYKSMHVKNKNKRWESWAYLISWKLRSFQVVSKHVKVFSRICKNVRNGLLSWKYFNLTLFRKQEFVQGNPDYNLDRVTPLLTAPGKLCNRSEERKLLQCNSFKKYEYHLSPSPLNYCLNWVYSKKNLFWT